MKHFWSVLALALLVLGGLAFYLVPILWPPEPVLGFQVGAGAAIFAILFILALLIQLAATAYNWGKERSARKVGGEREEAHRQFLRRLDHELKNPLTGLQAALTNLREAQSAEETAPALENAGLAAARLQSIFRDLRKLADLDTQMLEFRPVDVGELVGEMVSAAASLPKYQGRTVNLLVSRVPSLPAITGDRDMLGLAFFNLVENALKFSAPGDAVEARVREDGRSLFIEVADSGLGIAPEEQGRIFEDLYRGENARGTEGSGVGLALAGRIVQLHGGEIGVRSDPGRTAGAVFTVRLPIKGVTKP